MSWREQLNQWIRSHYPTRQAFADAIGLPRETVRDWVKPPTKKRQPFPSHENQHKIFEFTGIAITEEGQQLRVSTGIQAEQHTISLAHLIRATAALTLEFLMNSTPADRQNLRVLLNSDMESYLNSGRGLYSEKSWEQVQAEIRKSTRNTQGG